MPHPQLAKNRQATTVHQTRTMKHLVAGLEADMTTQQPTSRWKLFAIVIVAAGTVTYLFGTTYPWFALLSGFAIFACSAAYAAWPPMSQSIARWRQSSSPVLKTRIVIAAPIACYGVILLAISQSQIRADWDEAAVRLQIAHELDDANSAVDRDRLEEALKICTDLDSKANAAEITRIASIRNRVGEIENVRNIKTANSKVLQVVSEGEIFVIRRQLDNAESRLNAAFDVPLANEFSRATEFADQIVLARSKLATAHFEKGDLSSAKDELRRAVNVPQAKSTVEAQQLLIDVCNHEVRTLVAEARQDLNGLKRDDAATKLSRALAITEATETQEAQRLLTAINESRVSDANDLVSELAATAQKSFEVKDYEDAIRTLKDALVVPHSTQNPQIIAQLQRIQKEQTAERDRQLAIAKAEQKRKARAAAQVVRKRKWYEGGTLHKKSGLEWQTASRENKLATCADFVATMWQKGNLKPSVANRISTVDDVRPYALELIDFLDAAFKSDPDPEQNRKLFTNQTVGSFAAIGMVTMRWAK
jgi:tetratricopeptide (TPR) repeat protein